MGRMVAAVAVVLAQVMAAGQQAPAVADNYRQARQLLDRAIAAHGGEAALRRARRARIELAGEDVWRHQSRTPAAPYDRRPSTATLHLDLDAGRVVLDAARSYPGNIHRQFRFATGAAQSFYVNHRHRTYTVEDYPPADQQLNNLNFVPSLILQLAHDSGTRLRSLGRVSLASGAAVHAITTTASTGSLTIGLDPDTHRLRAMMLIRNDAVEGQVASEIEYLEYRDAGGVLTPGRRTVSTGGAVVEDYRYRQVSYGEPVADALVAPPPGYREQRSAETPAVRPLAENVWLVGGASASLVVSLGDDVIVVDAAPSAAAAIRSAVSTLLPGRRITYVVPTHHHDDHAPGLRALAADGAAVLSAPGNKAFFEGMLQRPVVTIEGGRRVFGSGDRSVEIHNIGPSPHAEDMLVAWLPKEGILFEADLIDASAPGTIGAGANNETTVHFARWIAARGWQVRQFAGAHGAIIDAAAFTRLAASAVLPGPSDR